MMTQRLYYDDAYLTEFTATITERGCDPCEVYLDRTAFYPTSGGQPYDTGTIDGVPVIDVIDHDDCILHRLARPVNTNSVRCEIDWRRRFDHMQQHSGQHLLSAVFASSFQADTVSFHLGGAVSTIDLDVASLTPEQIRTAEERANEIVFENRAITTSYENASEAAELRKESGRTGTLRIVSIRDHDRSPCGGTHVRFTGEIGQIILRKTDKIRGCVRVEFLCGHRAIHRARQDYDTLDACARVYSSAIDEVPVLAAAAQEKLAESEKQRKRLARELAWIKGRDLYHETTPDEAGLRRVMRRMDAGSLSEDVRTEAQSFSSLPRSVFLALTPDPPSVLLATSADSGVHAVNALRDALSQVKGRGGGNQQMAQGSAPDRESLEKVARILGW